MIKADKVWVSSTLGASVRCADVRVLEYWLKDVVPS
jgi:hypothetical protein